MSTNTDATTGHANREAWLAAGVELFRPLLVEVGAELPEKIRVSVGFGPSGARQENANVLGVTLKRRFVSDGVSEVWISPIDADTTSMLETLLHELIHVSDDCESGHKGHFAEIATRLGCLSPMTSTPSSIELAATLMTMAATLGEYPGGQVNLTPVPAQTPAGVLVPVGGSISSAAGPQKARQLKIMCTTPDCPCGGYTARTTAKWLEIGVPSCPFGHPMARA